MRLDPFMLPLSIVLTWLQRIRYGTKMLDLHVRPETFRHEIYSTGTKDSASDLGFSALVSHEAHVKTADTKAKDHTMDADVAALKESLASMAKEKEARKYVDTALTITSCILVAHADCDCLNRVTLSDAFVSTSKNATPFARRRPASLLNRSVTSSANSTPRPNATAPTSAPQQESLAKAQEKGMRAALVHLLAIKPVGEQDIATKTRIPKSQLEQLLPKIAEKSGPNWALSSKSYKDLNPWTFKYQTETQRQSAIDNAIRAFDRIRVAKDDKLWQVLLPIDERGKGKVLSKLHLGIERRDQHQQQGTPGLAPTPVHHTIEKVEAGGASPSIALASTPRNGAVATGRSANGISIEKRLKEAKKKQELERKKKEKEAGLNDREAKLKDVTKPRPTTAGTTKKRANVASKNTSDKIKSAETVHSSDDEEGEITEPKPKPRRDKEVVDTNLRPASKRDTPIHGDSKMTPKLQANAERRIQASKPSTSANKSRPVTSQVSHLPPEDIAGVRPLKRTEGTTMAKEAGPTSTTARPRGTTISKQTPVQKPVKSSSSAMVSTQRQHPVSPRKDTRPKVPSPLGTTKPRNASEEADNMTHKLPASRPSKPTTPAFGATQNAARAAIFGAASGRPGRPIPVIKKRPLERADIAQDSPRKASKLTANSTTKGPVNDVARAKTSTNNMSSARPTHESNLKRQIHADSPAMGSTATPKNTDSKLKRKANDISSGFHDHEVSAPKHRKTNSSSTHSVDHPTNSSLTSLTTAPTVSPEPSPRSPSQRTPPSSRPMDVIQRFLNDAEASPKTQSTWESALDKADKFQKELYPAYLELYDQVEAMPQGEVDDEQRRALFMMHNKLKAYKKDIYDGVGRR